MCRLGFAVSLLFCASVTKVVGQDVSVDPSSGNAIVTIPLHTLKYGSITVPVNLVHSGNALNVSEGEGDAGFGWNLSCNYGVFREVRGFPDETNVASTKYGWLIAGASIQTFTPTSNDNYSSADWSDESSDWGTLNNFVAYVDSEPDIYTVSGPNLFARFIYDGSGAIRLLEYQDIEITPLASANGFTVKNNIGHVYQFTTKERVTRKADAYRDAVVDMFTREYDYYKDSGVPQFTNTWHLTSVTDENGLAVNFNYTAQPLTKSVEFRTRITTATNAPDTLYMIENDLIPQSLTSITAGSYAVTFNRTSARLLNTVAISESQLADTYKYAFTYQNAGSTQPRGGLHYFLKEIKLFSMGNCNTEVPYKFAYQGVSDASGTSSVDFPWGNRYSQDMWGFYNGTAASYDSLNVVPALNFYSALTDGRRFVFYTIPGETNTPMAGANRNTNANKIATGVLLQITYPAGGYTKIEWERNKYLDSLGGKVVHGPGLRVKSVTTSGGDAAYNGSSNPATSYHDIVKTYKYERSETDTTSSGIIFYPPSYGLSTGTQQIRTLENQAPETQVAYRRIKESVSGFGYKVYIYSYPARYPFTTYSTDWAATKSRIARNPSSNHAALTDVKNGYYIFPFAPNPNYTFSQGLLTSVREFSQAGVMMREKKTYYSRVSPALASVYGVRFEKFTDCNCFHFSRYEVITGTTSVVTQEVVRTGDDQTTPVYSTDTYDYYYNSDVANNNFLLSSIKHTMANGSMSQRYLRYVKDFAAAVTNPASSDVMANAIKLMATARRHGEVVESYTVFTPAGGSSLCQDATLQLFKDFGSGKVYPYRRYSFPNGATLTPAAAVPGATQTFSSDADYFLTVSQDDFDANSNTVSVSDDDKNSVAMHYAQNFALPPVAKFARATAKQTVYDGFEFATGRNLSGVTSTVTPGWTGERSATLTNSGIFYHNAVENNGKPYRVSCYVKASANATITFKFLDPATQADLFTTPLSYAPSTLNTWVYLEGVLNVNSAAFPTVKLKITSTATVTIDDVIVMPKDASVSAGTFLPFKGPTSQTDDRGYSTAVTYDDFGRQINVFDRQRNLVELNEYTSKGAKPAWINSGFYTTDVTAGVAFTANAYANCFANPQYQWKLNDVAIGTNSSALTTTVSKPGLHTLSLTVTNPSSGASSTTKENLCVSINSSTPTFTLTISNPSNPGSPDKCNVGSPMGFTVTPLTYCGTYPASTKVKWEFSSDGTTYSTFGGSGNTETNGGLGIGNTGTFYIRVTVFQTCSGGQGDKCNGSTIMATSKTVSINQIDCRN